MAQNWNKEFVSYRQQLAKLFELYKERPDIRAFLEIILSLITIIIFSLFAIRPTANTIANLIQENNGKQETLDILNTKIKSLNLATQLYEQQADRIVQLNQAVPDDPEIENVTQALQTIVTEPGAILKNESFEKAPIKGNADGTSFEKIQNAKTVPVAFQANGQYGTLLPIVQSIQNLRRRIYLDSVNITLPTQDNTTTTIREPLLNIKGEILYHGKN
jgi:Tfp pilus assembly protein PilO